MRRSVVHALVLALTLATVLPSAPAAAQEPAQPQTERRWERPDNTLYIVGLGAILGVAAFNLAAPVAVSSWSSVGRFVGNSRALLTGTGRRIAGLVTGRAVAGAAPAAVAAPVAATASAAPAAAAAAGTAARGAATGGVPPLTQSMLAQAQAMAVTVGAAGALAAHYLYILFY
jgi:hypothetical protein